MAKLWCPICKLSNFNSTQSSQITQQHINAHLLAAHSHTVTSRNEKCFRQLQNRRWAAADEALDLKLRQNTRNKQIEWEAFAENARIKDIPSTNGMEDKPLTEMVWLNEIEDDSDDEGDGGRMLSQTRAEMGDKDSMEPKKVVGSSKQQSLSSDQAITSNPDSDRKSTDAVERELKRQRRRAKRPAARKDLAAFRRFESGG